MPAFHIPIKDPVIDLKTGLVTPRWKRLFEAINDLVTALDFGNISGTITLAQLVAHASTHRSGGSDAIKLDDLATPDDNTDLNATDAHHGLLPKLSGNPGETLHGDGTWS
jgi:hypothetical protein